jgi:hypothetical protein
MSHPVQPVTAVPAPPPPAGPAGRPVSVTVASALLWAMAAAGLIYAVITLTVVPGTVSRFRSDVTDADGLVSVVWVGAAIATALAVILFALYIVLGLALRRGSNGARIATLVICALGLLAGCGSAATVGIQRSGDPVASSAGERLSSAYPDGWVGINVGLSVAQMVAYIVVGVLLLTAPKAFFGRGGTAATPHQHTYGSYGGAGLPGGPGQPGGFDPSQPGAFGPPQPGAFGSPQPGYGSPRPGYGPSQPAYGPPQPGYGPPHSGYGPPHPGYGPPQPVFGPPQPGHGSPQAGYGPPPVGYGPPQPGYGPAPSGYEPPLSGSGQFVPGDSPHAQPAQVHSGQVEPGQISSEPASAASAQPGQAGSTPSENPGITPPGGSPARGSEDEYWSRPSE